MSSISNLPSSSLPAQMPRNVANVLQNHDLTWSCIAPFLKNVLPLGIALKAIKNVRFAEAVCNAKGIPLVEGKSLSVEDVRFLAERTISKSRIEKAFGVEVLGPVPKLRLDRFIQLRNSQDLFDTERRMAETFLLVLEPSVVEVTVSRKRPFIKNANGNLLTVQTNNPAFQAGTKLQVPFSLHNQKMLVTYPVDGMRTTPIINRFALGPVFLQCGSAPQQNKLSLQREIAPESTRSRSFTDQTRMIEDRGFEMADIYRRAILDLVKIEETGTCPDSRDPSIFVRCPDPVDSGLYRAAIGNFYPLGGVDITLVDMGDVMRAVPVGPAEVQAFGT